MTIAEAKVLKFLSMMPPDHVFNVTEVWYWLANRQPVAPPGDRTLRRYVIKHCQSLGRGQYQKKPACGPNHASCYCD